MLAEIVDKDQTRLYIEMKNKKLITNKQDTTFILAKENAEQAKKWIDDWGKEIIKYEKGRDIIEREIIAEKDIRTWIKKKNGFFENAGISFDVIDILDGYITISMNVVYGRRIIKYIYEFSDEETLKTWMEEFEAKIRTSNTKESVIRQIELRN